MSLDNEYVEEVEWYRGINLDGLIYYPVVSVAYSHKHISGPAGLVLALSIKIDLKAFDVFYPATQQSERLTVEQMKTRHPYYDDAVLKLYEKQLVEQILSKSGDARIAATRAAFQAFAFDSKTKKK